MAKSRFQRRHYVAIAEILADMENGTLQQSLFSDIRPIAQAFATYFEADNPRFDRERFLRACGVTQ